MDGKRQFCLLPAKSFNRFGSHKAFSQCVGKTTEVLVEELQNTLRKLRSSHDSSSSSCNISDESAEPVSDSVTEVEKSQGNSTDLESDTASCSKTSSSRKRKCASSGSTATKKATPNDEMKESCEKCLVSTTSQFIPIKKLGLPVRPSRQFRRVNEAFVDSLKEALLQEPSGCHGCLFVVAKGIESKETFDPAKKDAYEYEVLGGTHLMLATKKLHSQFPENIYYQGRMARIYCGLTDDQAIYLGAMHQKSSSFCHDITYREEVERCRSQLYGELDLQNEPPRPRPSWRDDCSRILYKDKRILCEVFAMAQVSLSTWLAFIEVNNLYESGKIKGQKFSPGDIMKGKLAMKQWHMKPLVSLPDESKCLLLNKISSGEILLKDLKKEADKIKTLNTVKSTVMSFFKLEDWDEVVRRFGTMVNNEKLLRFKEQLEVEEKCIDIVKLLSRLNFTVLSSFNCTIMCPVHWAHVVKETFVKEGASLTQQGFVYHKKELRRKQSTVMQEVVSSFVVGHWASSRVVGSSHVNYVTPRKNIVEVTAATIGEEYPVSFFKEIISWFSKNGDLILEVGCGEHVGM